MQDSWNSVERTIDYYGDNQDVIIANAGPGQWNDPDMLIVGKHLEYQYSSISITEEHKEKTGEGF